MKLPWKDMKRSLLGQLLMRRACAQTLGDIDFSGHTLGRTFGKKPFLSDPLPPSLPNFNFNVSHDGRWIVLATDSLRLVGTDVSAPQSERGDSQDDEYLTDLEALLHENELWAIKRMPSVSQRYSVFQRIWSAKESVTKAVGQGIDFGLERIDVTLDGDEGESLIQLLPWFRPEPKQVAPTLGPFAEVRIDSWERPDWDLKQYELPGNYWVTVALGPVSEAVDRNGTFLATLRRRGVDEAARRLESEAPTPPMQVLSIEDLPPEAAAAQFAQMRASPFTYG